MHAHAAHARVQESVCAVCVCCKDFFLLRHYASDHESLPVSVGYCLRHRKSQLQNFILNGARAYCRGGGKTYPRTACIHSAPARQLHSSSTIIEYLCPCAANSSSTSLSLRLLFVFCVVPSFLFFVATFRPVTDPSPEVYLGSIISDGFQPAGSGCPFIADISAQRG